MSLRINRRQQVGRTLLAVTLTLLMPVQELLARGGGGFHGGGGGGGGGFHGGGGGGGGGGGFHGGGGGGGAGGNHGGGGGGYHPGGGGAGAGGRGPAGGGAGAGGNRGQIGEGGNRGNFNAQGNRNPFSGNRAGNNNIGNRTNINNVNVHNNNFNNFHNNAFNNNWHHNYNNYWHHGYWPGYGHGWGWGGGWGWGWGYPWGAAALGGMIGWGLGSMYYSSGYGSYSNPYYVATPAYAGTYLDYSQPIPVSADTQSYAQTDGSTDPNAPVITPADTPPSPEVQAALKPFDDAREAFKAGDYKQALTKVDEALKSLPNDAALHEFRALVLFAQAKYQEAAAVIYSVLSVGPGWDWTTLSSMYADVDVYTKQLRTLEDYSKAHPDSADAAFVLGYQYLSCGHNESAAKQFQTVARLLPNDQLAPQLVKMIGAKSGDQEPPQPPPSADPNAKPALPPEDDGPPIDKSKIVGTWKSARGKAVAIDLALKGDGSFTWKVNQGGKTNVIEGNYEVEGNLLMLKQTSDGNTMVGRVLMADKPGFNFKLVGSGPNDPGLDFAK